MPTRTPIPTATSSPVPTPTPTPIVISGVCGFDIRLLSDMVEIRVDPDRCSYQWQDASNTFDIEVNVYGSLSGRILEERVVNYTERVNETEGAGSIALVKTAITYDAVTSGIQNDHPYHEVIGRSVGYAYLNTCDTLYISRFFALDDWDDDTINVSATVCERDWERVQMQSRIMSVLDSFRPIPDARQQ